MVTSDEVWILKEILYCFSTLEDYVTFTIVNMVYTIVSYVPCMDFYSWIYGLCCVSRFTDCTLEFMLLSKNQSLNQELFQSRPLPWMSTSQIPQFSALMRRKQVLELHYHCHHHWLQLQHSPKGEMGRISQPRPWIQQPRPELAVTQWRHHHQEDQQYPLHVYIIPFRKTYCLFWMLGFGLPYNLQKRKFSL